MAVVVRWSVKGSFATEAQGRECSKEAGHSASRMPLRWGPGIDDGKWPGKGLSHHYRAWFSGVMTKEAQLTWVEEGESRNRTSGFEQVFCGVLQWKGVFRIRVAFGILTAHWELKTMGECLQNSGEKWFPTLNSMWKQTINYVWGWNEDSRRHGRTETVPLRHPVSATEYVLHQNEVIDPKRRHEIQDTLDTS